MQQARHCGTAYGIAGSAIREPTWANRIGEPPPRPSGAVESCTDRAAFRSHSQRPIEAESKASGIWLPSVRIAPAHAMWCVAGLTGLGGFSECAGAAARGTARPGAAETPHPAPQRPAHSITIQSKSILRSTFMTPQNRRHSLRISASSPSALDSAPLKRPKRRAQRRSSWKQSW